MIEVSIHFQGMCVEQRTLAAVPRAGEYVYGPKDSRIVWQVRDVVFCGASIAVFCDEVSVALTQELETQWDDSNMMMKPSFTA